MKLSKAQKIQYLQQLIQLSDRLQHTGLVDKLIQLRINKLLNQNRHLMLHDDNDLIEKEDFIKQPQIKNSHYFKVVHAQHTKEQQNYMLHAKNNKQYLEEQKGSLPKKQKYQRHVLTSQKSLNKKQIRYKLQKSQKSKDNSDKQNQLYFSRQKILSSLTVKSLTKIPLFTKKKQIKQRTTLKLIKNINKNSSQRTLIKNRSQSSLSTIKKSSLNSRLGLNQNMFKNIEISKIKIEKAEEQKTTVKYSDQKFLCFQQIAKQYFENQSSLKTYSQIDQKLQFLLSNMELKLNQKLNQKIQLQNTSRKLKKDVQILKKKLEKLETKTANLNIQLLNINKVNTKEQKNISLSKLKIKQQNDIKYQLSRSKQNNLNLENIKNSLEQERYLFKMYQTVIIELKKSINQQKHNIFSIKGQLQQAKKIQYSKKQRQAKYFSHSKNCKNIIYSALQQWL